MFTVAPEQQILFLAVVLYGSKLGNSVSSLDMTEYASKLASLDPCPLASL